jgi:alpha-galactosidase
MGLSSQAYVLKYTPLYPPFLCSYALAGADPDCIMCGHGGVSEAQCRSIFAVFAVTKSPLLLGSVIWNMTNETLATVGNRAVIAVNQVPF